MIKKNYSEYGTQAELMRQFDVTNNRFRDSQNRHIKLTQEFDEAYILKKMRIVGLEVLEDIGTRMSENVKLMESIVKRLEAIMIKIDNGSESKTDAQLIEKVIEYRNLLSSKN